MAFTSIAPPNEPRVSSLAQMITSAVATLDFGAVVTFNDLKRIICESATSQRGRAALHQAKKHLLVEHGKLLLSVRGEGYRIAQPNEHVGESKRLELHGRRKQRRALSVIDHTEEERLTAAELQQNSEQGNRLRIKLALDRKIEKAILTGNTVTLPAGKELARLLGDAAREG